MCCRTLWSHESFLKGVCELHGTCVSRRLAPHGVCIFFPTLSYIELNSYKTGTVGNDTTTKLGDETSACSVDIESCVDLQVPVVQAPIMTVQNQVRSIRFRE